MEINLDTLQAAIESDIRAAFTAFKHVEFYSEMRSDMPLPACVLELAEWQAHDEDAGTAQQPVMARFEARIITRGVQTKAAHKAIRTLAAALSAFLYTRRWFDPGQPGLKLPTGAAEFLGAYPDDFNDQLDQYLVWRIEWNQQIDLGASMWEGLEPIPEHIFIGIAPNIGPGHESDYIEVTA